MIDVVGGTEMVLSCNLDCHKIRPFDYVSQLAS